MGLVMWLLVWFDLCILVLCHMRKASFRTKALHAEEILF